MCYARLLTDTYDVDNKTRSTQEDIWVGTPPNKTGRKIKGGPKTSKSNCKNGNRVELQMSAALTSCSKVAFVCGCSIGTNIQYMLPHDVDCTSLLNTGTPAIF